MFSGTAIFAALPDSTTGSAKPLRTYHTTRLTANPPVIDGLLDDECWRNNGEWTGDFIQWIPNEGAKPSKPTYLKLLYDDRNIYVAFNIIDEPDKISVRAGRRDELSGDMIGINFDSYHDHRTGFEFNITAAGQQVDVILTNPMNGDFSWNAVWYSERAFTDSGWTAEFQIPLSQLRYSSDNEQVWGMHVWRWIDRLQEESDWEAQSLQGPGMLYLFGELHGISGLPASRRIEIMPYSLGKVNTFKKEQDNPFRDKGRNWFGNAGLDAKVGLSSNFTADITINPDFGQVESDPSVMNLTAFETFYEERRPFFLEGKNIFSFGLSGSELFYSRRIGHSPEVPFGADITLDRSYVDIPDNTTILGAAKISGKTADGLSIGILESLTSLEKAEIGNKITTNELNVEPLTNYLIARVQKDYNAGNSVIGGMLTSTNRFINEKHLEYLNRNAYTGGIDILHYWSNKEYYVDAKFVGSHITGSSRSMELLQNSSARYYGRPDADHLSFDSSRTTLSGYGGTIEMGRGSGGNWKYSTELSWRSPGLDLNDIGFLQTSDLIEQENEISYSIVQPEFIFRTYSFEIEQYNHWDFGMNHLSSGASFSVYLEFLNKWGVNNEISYMSRALDNKLLRGGNAMLIPSYWSYSFFMKTDPSARFFFRFSGNVIASSNNSGSFYIEPFISFMPLNILKFSVALSYAENRDNLQYIGSPNSGISGQQYVLGKINQHTLGLTFRVDYNITNKLSIQYYGSPFASVGEYSEFKNVTNPRADEYSSRFMMLNPVLANDTYTVYDGAGQRNYDFWNPDFNFSQFRSNLVLRWEYRPGSQVYLVWSSERTYYKTRKGTVGDAMEEAAKVYPDNIFLVKFNYWFSL